MLSLCNCQACEKFSDGRIRTTDLLCWKRPLCQLQLNLGHSQAPYEWAFETSTFQIFYLWCLHLNITSTPCWIFSKWWWLGDYVADLSNRWWKKNHEHRQIKVSFGSRTRMIFFKTDQTSVKKNSSFKKKLLRFETKSKQLITN